MLLRVLVPLIRGLVSGISGAVHGVLALPFGLTKLQPGSLVSALVGCLFSTCTYVGLVAVWGHLPRDHPTTIKKRFLSAGLACCLSWLPLFFDIRHTAQLQGSSTWMSLTAALGLRVADARKLWMAIGCSLLHTSILFSCPLVHTFWMGTSRLVDGLTEWFQDLKWAINARDAQGVVQALLQPLSDEHLWRWRNLVVAPVTEEFVFRACMAPLLLRAGCRPLNTVLATPLFFGAAHLHHLRERVHHQRVALSSALALVLVQFTYTAVFGWYATWLFLRTGSLWPPIATHTFCNWLGFPNFSLMAQRFGPRVLAVATAASIAGFMLLLKPLTDPSLTGGPLVVNL